VRRKPVIRDYHRVPRAAPAIEIDRRMAPVRHDQRALNGGARRDMGLCQDEPVRDPLRRTDQPDRPRGRADRPRPRGCGPRRRHLSLRGATASQQTSCGYESRGEQATQTRLPHGYQTSRRASTFHAGAKSVETTTPWKRSRA
jgi:hypothetical protein